jgi:putative phage-type endonuclease
VRSLATPLSPQWHERRRRGIGGSEIAVVLGLSPFESPFSLYWRKVNGWELDEDSSMRSGRYLEPAVASWWEDEYDPQRRLRVVAAGLYEHPDRAWQLATPDRLVYERCLCGGHHRSCGVCGGNGWVGDPEPLECKAPYSWDGFGETGTDVIPVYYRAQVLWQMDVLGAARGWLAAYAQHEFRCFVIRHDERDLRVMREAGARFIRRLDGGVPPALDEHVSTVAVLKMLHPDLDDVEVDVGERLAAGWRRAVRARRLAETLWIRYEAGLRQAMGRARVAVHAGSRIATRSVYDVDAGMRRRYHVDKLTTSVERRPRVHAGHDGR